MSSDHMSRKSEIWIPVGIEDMFVIILDYYFLSGKFRFG